LIGYASVFGVCAPHKAENNNRSGAIVLIISFLSVPKTIVNVEVVRIFDFYAIQFTATDEHMYEAIKGKPESCTAL
jgi:hypothetical protein